MYLEQIIKLTHLTQSSANLIETKFVFVLYVILLYKEYNR